MPSNLQILKKRLFGLVTKAMNRGTKLEHVTINGICKFNTKTIIGQDCHFNGVWIDGPGEVTIGHSCHFGKKITIFTQNHNYDSSSKLPYDNDFVIKPVKMGNYVWIGSSAIILPGTEIGDGAIVQAGAVVHGRLEPCGIYGGNPAVKFASRDEAQFARLNEY